MGQVPSTPNILLMRDTNERTTRGCKMLAPLLGVAGHGSQYYHPKHSHMALGYYTRGRVTKIGSREWGKIWFNWTLVLIYHLTDPKIFALQPDPATYASRAYMAVSETILVSRGYLHVRAEGWSLRSVIFPAAFNCFRLSVNFAHVLNAPNVLG